MFYVFEVILKQPSLSHFLSFFLFIKKTTFFQLFHLRPIKSANDVEFYTGSTFLREEYSCLSVVFKLRDIDYVKLYLSTYLVY